MSEEFKCPSCGGTASIAYHRSEDNLLYCQDCQKTFSERYAKIREQAARIAELEELAEARKLANRLLEQERNELEAERDRLREALQIIASGHFSGRVELVNTEEMKTVWKSDVGLPMTVSEARDIARKALEGAKNE